MPGLFKSQKGAKQEANSQQRLSIEDAHLLGHITDAQEIEQNEALQRDALQEVGCEKNFSEVMLAQLKVSSASSV